MLCFSVLQSHFTKEGSLRIDGFQRGREEQEWFWNHCGTSR